MKVEMRFAGLQHGSYARVAAVWLALLGAGAAEAHGTAPAACAPVAPLMQGTWALADFNGDATPDLAAVFLDGPEQTPHLGVSLRTRCSGGLPRLATLAPGPGPMLTVWDVDADDDPDLVLRHPHVPGALRVWLNDGQGRFSPAEPAVYSPRPAPRTRLQRRALRQREAAVVPAQQSGAGPVESSALPPPALHAAVRNPWSFVAKPAALGGSRQPRAPPVLPAN